MMMFQRKGWEKEKKKKIMRKKSRNFFMVKLVIKGHPSNNYVV